MKTQDTRIVLFSAFLSAVLAASVVAATPAPTAAPKPAPAPPLPNEVVTDAVPATYPIPPVQPRGVDPFPVTTTLGFTIDRVGRVRDITADQAKLRDPFRDAARAAVAHWRFWPALGACRYVEQQATVTFAFDAKQVRQTNLVFTPVPALRVLRNPNIARIYALDGGDPRHIEPHPPAGFVDVVPLDSPPPGYPAAASRKAMPGYAFVLIDIGADGKVKTAQATDAWSPDPKFAPLFGGEAMRAIKLWKFKPATQDGKPQPRTACQRFMFNMQLGG